MSSNNTPAPHKGAYADDSQNKEEIEINWAEKLKSELKLLKSLLFILTPYLILPSIFFIASLLSLIGQSDKPILIAIILILILYTLIILITLWKNINIIEELSFSFIFILSVVAFPFIILKVINATLALFYYDAIKLEIFYAKKLELLKKVKAHNNFYFYRAFNSELRILITASAASGIFGIGSAIILSFITISLGFFSSITIFSAIVFILLIQLFLKNWLFRYDTKEYLDDEKTEKSAQYSS